jgi:hypothetical protein
LAFRFAYEPLPSSPAQRQMKHNDFGILSTSSLISFATSWMEMRRADWEKPE